MDRPLGKKFEPRPKRIQRSDGSYWVANPCVSEHFLTKQIGDIDRQKAMFSSAQSRQQRQLHQDLNNIKATKNCRPGPGYFRRRGNGRHSVAETTFSDMIDKFNKHRAEQHFVNNLLKKRRESMYSISGGRNRKFPSDSTTNMATNKTDILNIDQDLEYESLSHTTDDDTESFRNLSMSGTHGNRQKKSPQTSKIPSRHSVYEVTKDNVHHDLRDGNNKDEITYTRLPRSKPKPSWAGGNDSCLSNKTTDKRIIPDEKKQNKVKSKRAEHLWGLIRENTLYPDDIKSLKDNNGLNEQESHKECIHENMNSRPKTDDQKLLEKQHDTVTRSHSSESNNVSFEKIKTPIQTLASENVDSKEECRSKNRNSGLLNKGQNLDKPSKYRIQILRKTTNQNVPITRPKSARGRGKNTCYSADNITNKGTCSQKDDEHESSSELEFKAPKCKATNDDDASLNNYLYLEKSEHEISNSSDRKMSYFDLNIDDNTPEVKRPSERMGQFQEFSVERNYTDEYVPFDESQTSDKHLHHYHGNVSKTSSSSHKKNEDLIKKSREKINDELWEDVKKCRYLRGYDPPEMIMPTNVNVFVFGKDENDIIEEIRIESLTKDQKSDEKCQIQKENNDEKQSHI
ncbi:uncharacterized protein [Mytilus edulis]|uniref:uncharacterized protein n=1 Tax=Mytilus edulis TaxID=6550 RepID=UPI0039EF7D6D